MTDSDETSVASAQVQFKLAALWQMRGQWERAVAGYEAAIRLRPDYLPAHLELGQLLLRQGALERALVVYRRAGEANPDEPVIEQKLAELTARLEPREAAGVIVNPPTRSEQDYPNAAHIALYTDCANLGGAQQCNHALAIRLTASGYRVTLVQGHTVDASTREREGHGIRHAWLEDDDLYDPARPARALTSSDEAQRILSELRPDLLIFSDGAPFSSLSAKEVAGQLGIPFLIIVHCVASEWAEQFAPYLDRLAATYRAAQEVIAVAEANLRLLHERFRLAPERGIVIYNGRPPRFFAAADKNERLQTRRALGVAPDDIVICTIASLELRKGYQLLTRAMKSLRQDAVWPRLRFVWIGAGSIEPQLRAVVEQIGAKEQVRFLGQRSDVVALLDASDIFALTSYYEGMPLSIMEAMARGKPVVATAVSGVGEQLGDNGKLLPDPARDPAATVQDLVGTIRLWATDSGLREMVRNGCERRAATLFTEEQMLAKYMQVVDRFLVRLK